ncbi:divergent polysaccharide deacetylase family protein [Pseudomonas panipatensis]|uniref:Divergent polysaccharide deacetylase n=1 Tax=Pseudomonas panipatensis TaxID=428992 RepID=A0A1G8K3Q0_9PSED|nr:divergent polysaccharide deacetylase family protein [Pseudomonas panipatensis]SDI37997.1 hypothetical protein SAMN05216272_108233 [Pseudomonas panipatensis]SMP60997.1 hypothetical protein SAMN06295951_105105 [Pseudomonas panipatensis]
MRRAGLLFGLCLAALFGQAQALSAEAPEPRHPLLSVVIDDLGQSLERDRQVFELPPGVAMAIMPDTPHAAELAREAHQRGRTLLLHLPMDPAGGPFAWSPELPAAELSRRLDAALAAVPYVQGVNNHEGSRMTADRAGMDLLMATLQERHLFFLDSRTSAATVAAAAAQQHGLASLSRDVFLDDQPDEASIARQLQTGIALARKQGSALLIGHPRPATLRVLARELPKLRAAGIELVEPTLLIAERGNRAMAAHGKNGVYR